MSSPNIVFIMADDMGWGDPACYGATRIQTPNMDRLACEGVRFLDAHSSSAVCTPSRYSVVTGRYCWRSRLEKGVLGGFGAPIIEPQRLTAASLLKLGGYRTAAIGKWHLGLGWRRRGGLPLENPDDMSADGLDVDYSQPFAGGPLELGFDEFFGIAGSLDMPPYCFLEDDHTVGIPIVEKSPYMPQQRKGLMVEGWRDDLCDVTFAGKAVEFIEKSQRSGVPFFLYLTPAAPHRPCVPPAFVRGKSRAGLRGDAVMLVDWMTGKVLETLDRLHLRENTLVVLTSDNGGRLTDYWGRDWGHKANGDFRGGKADIWDGGHREPLLVRWPERVAPGTTSSQLVCLGDFLATVADILGQKLPEEAAEDSCSMLPVLEGRRSGAATRQSVIHHSLHGMFAVRSGPWKMIEGMGSGGFTEPRFWSPGPDDPQGQLYNMEDDPRENLNLWQRRADVVDRLQSEMARARQRGG
jgi:arylsulfatase A-like enzyme